jgi:hypothetical protein
LSSVGNFVTLDRGRVSDVESARVWLRADALFEPEPDREDSERLTAAGKAQLDVAFAPSYLVPHSSYLQITHPAGN